MNKKFLNVLLCGVAILSMGVFNSCKTDVNDLEARVRILEEKLTDLKTTLGDAAAKGLFITSGEWSDNGKLYTIIFSDTSKVEIPIVETGGTTVTVTLDPDKGVAVITIDGEPYEIPLGSAVSSLVYRPEFEDGIAYMGTNGMVNVKFLATPTLSAASVASATFEIADIYEVSARTRLGAGGLVEIVGTPSLGGDGYISVDIKGLDVQAGKTYATSIKMAVSGTTISSNYFNIAVDSNFTGMEVAIDPAIVPIAKYAPEKNEAGQYTITVDGLEMLKALNFKDFFGTTAPAGATFEVAGPSQQPEGDARNKQGMLKTSLAADGTWAFSDRPGTAFSNTGFLFNVISENKIKAQVFVKIDDPIAKLDWVGPFKEMEAEYGGRVAEKALPLGASTIDFQPSFASFTDRGTEDVTKEWVIIHGDGQTKFFEPWQNMSVGGEAGNVLYNNGERAELSAYGEQFVVGSSRGMFWYCKGLAFYIPEPYGEGGSNGIGGFDWWGPGFADGWYIQNNSYMFQAGLDWGFNISKEGIITIPESYTGWGLRLALGLGFEYAYGIQKLGAADQLGLFYYNRRSMPEGTVLPSAN